jgi:hypothetical protein
MNAKSLYDHLIEAGAAGPALDACRRFSRSFRAPGLCGLNGVPQIIRADATGGERAIGYAKRKQWPKRSIISESQSRTLRCM